MKASIFGIGCKFLAESGSGHAWLLMVLPSMVDVILGRGRWNLYDGARELCEFRRNRNLKKQRQEVASCECILEAERADCSICLYKNNDKFSDFR